MMIVTGDTFYKPHPLWIKRRQAAGDSLDPWEWVKLVYIIPATAKAGIMEQGIDRESPPLTAYVNHGRWIIKCECGGAEKSFESGVFMCRSCFNAAHKHKYRLSAFPNNRKHIESLLNARPILNRNWYIGEPVENLVIENREHREELLEVY